MITDGQSMRTTNLRCHIHLWPLVFDRLGSGKNKLHQHSESFEWVWEVTSQISLQYYVLSGWRGLLWISVGKVLWMTRWFFLPRIILKKHWKSVTAVSFARFLPQFGRPLSSTKVKICYLCSPSLGHSSNPKEARSISCVSDDTLLSGMIETRRSLTSFPLTMTLSIIS
jgi:hypothetical protein